MQEVELVMLNGDLITTFKREALDVTVDYLIDNLEQGMVSGVDGPKYDNLGVFVERFSLVIGNEVMQRLESERVLVTEYFDEGEGPIQITLVKQPVEDAIYKELRRQAELEHELGMREYYTDEDRLR